METDTIHTGDAFDVLPTLPADSVHAVVCDPPYGLAFMGRDWDDFEPREYQQWCEDWACEVKRVLKPGGHLLAFSGNRTHHRLFSGVEDAGFEIRDTITWHYGSGFPKALDVSKAIDKRSDEQRDTKRIETDGNVLFKNADRPWKEKANERGYHEVQGDEPVTDAAERWDGFKTALKPATEYVVLARKPLSEGTVAGNVQTHGTGALNIDGTRIGGDVDTPDQTATRDDSRSGELYAAGDDGSEHGDKVTSNVTSEGRYPSNVVFDKTEAERLDAKNGTTESPSGHSKRKPSENRAMAGPNTERISKNGHGDSGGVSRYFYTSKATKAERTLDGRIDNAHPTVKPGDLMEWLVTLVTAEGQTVLDPFAGSGTTCRAAKDKARQFVGIEQQTQWADVARVRCGLSPDDPSHVRGDDAQRGFEAFE